MKKKDTVKSQQINKMAVQEVCDAIGDGVSIQDTDFTILHQNSVHKRIWGEHIGEYCYKAYRGNDSVCEGCPLVIVFKDGMIHTVERRVKTGKKVIDVEITLSPLRDVTGEILAGIEVVRDVTERKKVEYALKKSEHLLSSIFSSIQDGISILDRDLNIIQVNPAMEMWYSHSMPLIGRKCFEAYHSRDKTCDICPSVTTLKTGKPSYEIVPKRGDGGKITGWQDLYTFPLMDIVTNKLIGVIEYVRDITDRKQAEENLIKSENELKARVGELEEFYEMAVGRELRMKELKKKIEQLEIQLLQYKK